MSRSAIHMGLVDYVATAEELPAKLIQYIRRKHLSLPQKHVDASAA
ncbi:MAG: hypothetical protein ACYC4U_25060 [Pirellulaceae bacterium]